MPQAQIVSAFIEEGFACLAVAVNENGRRVEYVGSVPVSELNGLSDAEKRAKLVAAVKAVRDAEVREASTPISGMTGTVTL